MPLNLEPLRALLENTERAESIMSAARKWEGITQAAPTTSPDVLATLMQLDVRRIRSGGRPYTGTQSQIMLAQAQSPTPLLPEPLPGLWQRTQGDLRAIARGVVDLPVALVREGRALRELPGALAKAAAQPGIGGRIAGIAQAPGVRMLPGAFIAESLASGAPERLAEHPLYTLLDLVDAGTLAAPKLTGRTARQHIASGRTRATQAIERRFPTATPLDELAGRYTGLGPSQRQAHEVLARINRYLRRNVAADLARVGKTAAEAGLDKPQAMRALYETAIKGAPGWRGALDPEQARFIDLLERRNQRFANKAVREKLAFEYNGELYSSEHEAFARTIGALRTAEEVMRGPKFVLLPASRRDAIMRSRHQLQRKAQQLSIDTPPARFQPVIDQHVRDALARMARARVVSPDDVGRVLAYVDSFPENLVSDVGQKIPGFDTKTYQTLRHDIALTWGALKRAGYDPLFVHKVGTRRAREVQFPTVTPSTVRPAQTRARTLVGGEAALPNLVLATTHQAMEWMQREYTGIVFNQLVKAGIAKPAAHVQAALRERALGGTTRAGTTRPGRTPEMEYQRMLNRDWVQFDPKSLFPFARPKLHARGEQFLIPRSVAETLERWRKTPGPLTRIFSKPLGLFRTSVLALSPQYYVANILGDAILATARSDPKVLLYYPKAIRALKQRGALDPDLPVGLAELPPEVRTRSFEAGSRVGDWFFQRFGKDPAEVERVLWRVSEWINDTSRLATYMWKYDKEITATAASTGKAATHQQARRAAINHAKRVFQNWDSMTSIERNAIRSMMPFYGFTRFILRYVATYPLDHPIRASVLMNVARNEIADQPELERLRNTIFFSADEADTKLGVPMGVFNPFADFSNLFSTAGFLSKFNPVIQAGMAAMNIDPFTGAPGQFANEMRYDPRFGRMVPAPASFPRALLSEHVPQAGALLDVLSPTDDLTRLRETNPEAWHRRMLGGFGARIVPTKYNVAEERARDALARLDALRAALAKDSDIKYGPEAAEWLMALALQRAR